MKGIVEVELASGFADHSSVCPSAFYPNPASNVIQLRDPPADVMYVSIVDACGREATRIQVLGSEPLHVGDLPTGHYIVRVMDKAGEETQRQQLIVAR